MFAGIRTPAQVIALALEDNGVEPEVIESISNEVAKRLATALRSVSTSEAPVVIYSPSRGRIDWGTVHGRDAAVTRKAERKKGGA